MMNEKTIKKTKNRLKKIEGQIRGVMKMIEDKKYCIDIFQQISAICGGLKGINCIILENHLNTCVRTAIESGNEREIKRKIKEIVEIYRKFG